MRRVAASLLVLSILAGCSQNEEGKKAIADQCLVNGEAPEVCECLAKTSAEKLDPALFEIVVLGAKGEDLLTAQRMEELTPDMQARFSLTIPQILRECGTQGYLAGGGS
jgi:hypothetical protein